MRATDFSRPTRRRIRSTRASRTSVVLEVGEDKWPFPIPLVNEGGKWHFDSPTGVDELINRRVGANELDTIQSCLAYADAQREYYMRNPQKDPLLHYAGRLISTEGKKDGLYWPAGENEEQSPLGEGFAKARAEGYCEGRHDDRRALPRLHLPHADQAGSRTRRAAPMTISSTTSC